MELPVQFGNKVKILIHESYVLSATPEDVIPNNKKWTYNLEQNGYVIRAYVAYIIVVIREKLMDIASLMEEVPGTSSYAIDSTLWFNKVISYSGNTDVDHISEEILSRFNG